MLTLTHSLTRLFCMQEAYILETETYVAELSSLMRSADKASERTADSMIQVI